MQFVKIDYSEIDWTNKSVTATLKFDNKDMETCNKCNRALGIIYDLHKEIYEVVIGNKIPEGNDSYD